MRRHKLFSKLFTTYFLIFLTGFSILFLISRFAFKNFYFKETSTRLVQKARLVEKDVKSALFEGDIKSLQDKVKALANKSESRITVILPSGQVVADSSFNYKQMENHAQRIEVSQALEGGIGESARFSPTLEENHLYVAIPLKRQGRIEGVLRNSVSVEKLQESLALLTKNVLVWSLLLLLVFAYFIYAQAKKISSPLEKLKKQLDLIASGNFKDRVEVGESSTVEIASLISSFEGVSVKLQSQFDKINKQKNEQLAVFSSMLEGVITISPDMGVYHINKGALRLFNYSIEGSVKGVPLREVVKSERICKMAKELLENQKTVDKEFEYESGIVLNVHGTILQSEQTGMLGAVLVFNDITKMRKLESHRKQFVANVSHELKTPLTAIQGFLETIREGDVEDKETLNKFLDIINKHAARLKTIIEDLLTLSSIETESEVGGLQLQSQELLPVLKNVASLCHEKARAKGIDILLKGEDVAATVSVPLLEQAIINLLDNAIKYGPRDSEVEIRLEQSGSAVRIIVKDQGQGIEKKHHERLFERFYSVDKARSRQLGGSGLGLSIVKHIALSHGGNVWVESEPGKGSSFILELPLKDVK